MSNQRAYIVGIGTSPWSWPRSSISSLRTRSAVHQLAISSGTKALLDAGLSYDDVDLAIGFGDLRGHSDVFYSFGKTGISIHEVDNESALYAAAHFIRSASAHCVLLLGLDQSAAVGIVLASEHFIWRHPYLKDVAATVRGCAIGSPIKESPTMKSVIEKACIEADLSLSDIQTVESNAKRARDALDHTTNVKSWSSLTSLSGLCELVWLLRGWTEIDSLSSIQNCLQYTLTPNGKAAVTILSRADGKAAPTLKEVEHKNDGRERLGYNPAFQTKEIAFEDWESVKSRDDFIDERVAKNICFRKKGGDRAALAKI